MHDNKQFKEGRIFFPGLELEGTHDGEGMAGSRSGKQTGHIASIDRKWKANRK